MTTTSTPSAATPAASTGVSTAGLENLITAHQTALQQPGVLSVRPGYEITDGWLTGRRAIVATVTKKRSDRPPGMLCPSRSTGSPSTSGKPPPSNGSA